MPPKKKTKEVIRVKRFKDGSNNFWISTFHYSIINNKLVCCAGGIPDEDIEKKMQSYLKRNKIEYDI